VRVPHSWQECEPAVLALEGHKPADTARINLALQTIWARLSDAHREAFHQMCCHNDHSPEVMVLVGHINAALHRELDAQQN